MNRYIFRSSLLLLLLVFHSAIYAQSDDSMFTHKARHELEIGFGTPSFLFALGEVFTEDNVKFPVNIHSQYMYNVSKHFSIGANLTYSNVIEESYNYDEGFSDKDYSHLFTFGVTGRAYWFYKKNWAMYSKYGVTLSVLSNGSSPFFCPLNLSLVGVEAGGKRWRGYIEPLSLISTWPAAQVGVKYLF